MKKDRVQDGRKEGKERIEKGRKEGRKEVDWSEEKQKNRVRKRDNLNKQTASSIYI